MKILRVSVALFALLAALTVSAFALNDPADQAESLHTLGLLQGSGVLEDGSPNYDLSRQPTRAEAVTMLIRLLGKDAEAKEGDWEIPFTDVADWAVPYVGYAYANGLTKGTGADTFGGSALVDEQQYATFLLRSLGYSDTEGDFTFAQALDFAAESGVLDETGPAERFNRGVMVSDSYRALCAQLKGEERTLSNKLLYEDVFTTLQLQDTYDGKLLVAADMPDYVETSLEKPIRVETQQETRDLMLLLAWKNWQGGEIYVQPPTETWEETRNFMQVGVWKGPDGEYEYIQSLIEPNYSDWKPNSGYGWIGTVCDWEDGTVFRFWNNIPLELNLENYYRDPSRWEKNRLFHPENFTDEEVSGLFHPEIQYNYWENGKQQEAILSLIAFVDRMISENIRPGMTEREKAAALNSALCRHMTYDDDKYQNNGGIYLIENILSGSGVCYEYTLAYKMLCNAVGLECYYISGRAGPSPRLGDSAGHSWNQVKIDGKWYNVDVTWNDHPGRETAYLFKSDAFMRSHEHYSCSPDDPDSWFEGVVHDCPENLK